MARRFGTFAPALLLLTGCQGEVSGGGVRGMGNDSTTSGGVSGTGSTTFGGSVAAGGTSSPTAGSGGTVPAAMGGSSGTTGGSTASAGTSGTPGTSGTSNAGTGGAVAVRDCSMPHAAAARARLLSASQYTHTVQDLFQASGDPGAPLGNKVFEQLDDARVEQRADAAATVAREAALDLAKWAPCTPPAMGDASACEQRIIDEIGARAFRRPLTAEEKAAMKALFDAGIAEADFATGVEWYLTGLLQTPDFMYELARPDPSEIAGEVRPLAPSEYASRIAYFLWDSPPDETLMNAAAAGELSDAALRRTQVDRLLADPKFLRGVESFYRRWLNLEAFHEVARDAPGFDAAVVDALSTSLLLSATRLYASAAPNIAELFAGESYYMNDVLRQFYGLPGAGGDFGAVAMSGQGRRGILTHPGLMAKLARPKESFPIARGLFIVRNLFCRTIQVPDDLVVPELPPIQDGLSTRDRLEMHTSNIACAGCHAQFDPAGFALEAFDEVGRFRTVDHGQPVDTSGTMSLASDVDGAFATGEELVARLGTSADVRACFAEQYLKFALSRTDVLLEEDECSGAALAETFAPSGDLKQLVAAIVGTDAFRMRLAEGAAP